MGREADIHGVVQLGNLSGTATVDASKGDYFVGTLLGDVAITVVNVKPGHDLSVQVTQDIVGGHNVTWPGVTNGTTANGVANSTTVFRVTGSTSDMSAAAMTVAPGILAIGATSPLQTTAGLNPTISIVASGVPNANLSQMAANTIKGNNTGVAAAPADLTVAQAQTLLGVPIFQALTNVTTDVTIGSVNYTDITGLTITFTTTVAATIYASIAGCAGVSNSGNTFFQILLDGSPFTYDGTHGAFVRINITGEAGSGCETVNMQVAKVSVAAGSHTVKVQTKNDAGASVNIRPVSNFETMALQVVVHA